MFATIEIKKEYDRNYYINNRNKILVYMKKYTKNRFNKYPWLRTLSNIKRRVSHRKDYMQYGIKNFLTKEDIKFLWIRDRACEMKKPSIDRVDGFLDYTLDNCRFIEYQDNLSRPRCWRKKENSLRNLKGQKNG